MSRLQNRVNGTDGSGTVEMAQGVWRRLGDCGDGSGQEVLVVQMEGPEFKSSRTHIKEPGIVMHIHRGVKEAFDNWWEGNQGPKIPPECKGRIITITQDLRTGVLHHRPHILCRNPYWQCCVL